MGSFELLKDFKLLLYSIELLIDFLKFSKLITTTDKLSKDYLRIASLITFSAASLLASCSFADYIPFTPSQAALTTYSELNLS